MASQETFWECFVCSDQMPWIDDPRYDQCLTCGEPYEEWDEEAGVGSQVKQEWVSWTWKCPNHGAQDIYVDWPNAECPFCGYTYLDEVKRDGPPTYVSPPYNDPDPDDVEKKKLPHGKGDLPNCPADCPGPHTGDVTVTIDLLVENQCLGDPLDVMASVTPAKATGGTCFWTVEGGTFEGASGDVRTSLEGTDLWTVQIKHDGRGRFDAKSATWKPGSVELTLVYEVADKLAKATKTITTGWHPVTFESEVAFRAGEVHARVQTKHNRLEIGGPATFAEDQRGYKIRGYVYQRVPDCPKPPEEPCSTRVSSEGAPLWKAGIAQAHADSNRQWYYHFPGEERAIRADLPPRWLMGTATHPQYPLRDSGVTDTDHPDWGVAGGVTALDENGLPGIHEGAPWYLLPTGQLHESSDDWVGPRRFIKEEETKTASNTTQPVLRAWCELEDTPYCAPTLRLKLDDQSFRLARVFALDAFVTFLIIGHLRESTGEWSHHVLKAKKWQSRYVADLEYDQEKKRFTPSTKRGEIAEGTKGFDAGPQFHDLLPNNLTRLRLYEVEEGEVPSLETDWPGKTRGTLISNPPQIHQ